VTGGAEAFHDVPEICAYIEPEPPQKAVSVAQSLLGATALLISRGINSPNGCRMGVGEHCPLIGYAARYNCRP
jgi:hypothetical protein